MLPRLGSLGREEGRVTLSRVAWNSGTPFVHRQLVLLRRCERVFGFRRLMGGIVGPSLCRRFSGCSIFVSFLSFLHTGLVSPVDKETPVNAITYVWKILDLKTILWHFTLIQLVILEVDDFKLLLSVVWAGVHHVQQYHVTCEGSLWERKSFQLELLHTFVLLLKTSAIISFTCIAPCNKQVVS